MAAPVTPQWVLTSACLHFRETYIFCTEIPEIRRIYWFCGTQWDGTPFSSVPKIYVTSPSKTTFQIIKKVNKKKQAQTLSSWIFLNIIQAHNSTQICVGGDRLCALLRLSLCLSLSVCWGCDFWTKGTRNKKLFKKSKLIKSVTTNSKYSNQINQITR